MVTLIPSKEEDGEEDVSFFLSFYSLLILKNINGKKLKRITWGVAYRVHEDKVEEVKSYLDYRFISLINKKET